MNYKLQPKFPLKCRYCDATHEGGIDKAIDDGWNFSVLDTVPHGIVQLAGCPNHKKEIASGIIEYMESLAQSCRNKTEG